MGTMSRSESFLKSFAAIEKHLRSRTNCDRTVPFYQVVERAAERLPPVRRLRDDLKEFADLRNAIVHERTDGHTIAEPNDVAVREIQRIESLLLAPPKVVPMFQGIVESVEASKPIADAVTKMRRGKFSQLPVTDAGQFLGLLTSNTVARWLGGEAKEEIVSLADTSVRDVLRHTEDPDHFVFLARESTLFEVLEHFDGFEARGKRLDALLVTHAGKRSETLLGIITLWDTPKILKLVGPGAGSSMGTAA